MGFHTINAFEKTVEWEKLNDFSGRIGVKNLRFGDIVTDIEAMDKTCAVKSNKPYTLKINGKSYEIKEGRNEIFLRE